VSSRKSEEL